MQLRDSIEESVPANPVAGDGNDSETVGADLVAGEIQRVRAEYQRREREVERELYAPWQPSQLFSRSGRRRLAATLMHKAGVFPKADSRCLEIGFGSLGWLGELVTWRVEQKNLHGIELNPVLVSRARAVLPAADLRVGDATSLPWESDSFDLVITSTVFTSILDSTVRAILAREIIRVLVPGGALLWYDFAVNNPRNPQVRKVDRRELRHLFPGLEGTIQSVTLAPPILRLVAPWSWTVACMLESIPLLRSHLLAVLVKEPGRSTRCH